MSAETDADEVDEASLQIEPNNSDAEQPDDHTIYHCLIIPLYQKLKIAWYLLDKVESNGNVEQFILESW